jgi:hypothetical protein
MTLPKFPLSLSHRPACAEQESDGGKTGRPTPARSETQAGPVNEPCPRQEGVSMKRFFLTTAAAVVGVTLLAASQSWAKGSPGRSGPSSSGPSQHSSMSGSHRDSHSS